MRSAVLDARPYGLQMRYSGTDVLVVGRGVSGLTTAVCLADAGLRVRIRSEALPPQTTSAASGAMWGPYLVEPCWNLVEGGSRRTFAELRDLARDPRTGVRMVTGIEAARHPIEEPSWAHLIPDLRRCDARDLPSGFEDGFRFTVPLVDMPVYLGYLMDRLRTSGAQFEMGRLGHIAWRRSLDGDAGVERDHRIGECGVA